MCKSILLDCLVCGKQFKTYKSKPKKFCSPDCYRNPQAKDFVKKPKEKDKKGDCTYCGKAIYDQRSGESMFCDRICYDNHRIENWKSRSFCCANCGLIVAGPSVSTGSQARKYCSDKCRLEHKRPDPKNCKVCGCLFSAIKRYKNKDGSFKYFAISSNTCCSDACRRQFYRTDADRKEKIGSKFRKELHPNWQGGGADRGYRGHEWNKIAEKCRELHGRKCAHCGITEQEHGRKLEVNHILPFHQWANKKKANAQSNLEALCKRCHTKADRKWSKENPVQFSLDIFKR